MIKIILIILICMMLTSCETLKNIQNNETLDNVGSFRLNSIQPNNYWYNGKSYEYNEYQIEIISEPVQVKIEWDHKIIGMTPMVYSYSGTLDIDDYLVVRAIPVDGNLPTQEAVLRIRKELPRKIHFDLRKESNPNKNGE